MLNGYTDAHINRFVGINMVLFILRKVSSRTNPLLKIMSKNIDETSFS